MTQKMSNRLEFVRRIGMCPLALNLYVDRYSFKFFLNDVFSGIKAFLSLFPLILALAFFCGASPLQGIISCAIASLVGGLFGGSKYQIASIALPTCVLMFEILSKYQYKGLFYTAIFAAIILILFGLLRVSEVLKHISSSFVAALSVYVLFSILVNQVQYILGVDSIQSSQGLLENVQLLAGGIENTSMVGILTAAAFTVPILVLQKFARGFYPSVIYLLLGCAAVYVNNLGTLPWTFDIKTVGGEMIATQALDNITTLSRTIPSQVFLANAMNYAFIIAILIACEACFCTNVSASITGDKRLQTNAELVSTGISNFASVACGGLFVSPNVNFSLKNIRERSRTVIPIAIIAGFFIGFWYYSETIFRFIPLNCISGILLAYVLSELWTKKLTQYLNFKANDTYIFWLTFLLALYFGFIPATIVGFTASCVFFSKRMVRIKDATVHTTKNHDTGAVEFMSNKNGFMNSLGIPRHIIDKIEVIQISNVLFLNIAKVIEEALSAQGKFPSVLVVYFNNVPYLDGEAFDALRQLVKNATAKKAIVMVSGTNGMLLDILQQRASKEKNSNAFGYIIPNFSEAINQIVKRLGK
ncbi:MAG: SulP family inorganic anion transporter [Alphaproteobacteria bacterium]|nr:SulP family inorganic anion transporter [Alphaproteobacteria bacterium]